MSSPPERIRRPVAGVKGTTANWDWDVAGLYIRSNLQYGLSNYINYPNLLQALNGQGGFGYYRIGAALVTIMLLVTNRI